MKQVPLTQTPTVTLEWPEGDVFALSDETTTVYDLKLTNGDAQSLVVNASSTIAGCLLRPTRFLVPGKSQTYLTIVFPPLSSFPTDGLTRTDTLSLESLLLPPDTMLNLNVLFDTSSNRKHFKKTVLHLSYRTSSEEKSLDLLAWYSSYRLSTKLQFNYTSPGYTSAYIMLTNHHKGEETPPPGDCTAWRLSVRYPFWFSVRNHHSQAGHLLTEGDQAAFGYLSNGETHFTYIDFKGLGTFFGTELLDGHESCFMLEIFPLEKDPRLANGQIDEKQADEIRNAAKVPFEEKKQGNVIKQTLCFRKDRVTQEKRLQPLTPRFTFVFNGPSNQPQAASITISNEDKAHILVYRLQAQEPSLFKLLGTFLQPKATFGTFLALKPNQSEPLTVELTPGAKLNRNLITNHLFRLDTFLLDWEADTEDDYWPAMMRSMDARQLETTFIPCKFANDEALPSGAANSAQPSPGTPSSKPTLPSSSLPMTAPTEAQRKSSAPVPNSSDLRNRYQKKNKTKKPEKTEKTEKAKKAVSPKPTLTAATQQTLGPRPTPEAASKPSTGSADKQMEMVDNKQSPTGSSTVPQSPGSTVKSPSGAANSAQPSPGTPPSKPTITVGTASTAPSTEVPGKILPQTISSVCRQRNAPSQAQKKADKPKDSKKKENDKKTVSPMRTFTPKAASPGAAKPRTAKSKLLAPSKAARPHSPRRLPCRVPFSPVGLPPEEDMFELFNLLLIMAICLILLNALITVLA